MQYIFVMYWFIIKQNQINPCNLKGTLIHQHANQLDTVFHFPTIKVISTGRMVLLIQDCSDREGGLSVQQQLLGSYKTVIFMIFIYCTDFVVKDTNVSDTANYVHHPTCCYQSYTYLREDRVLLSIGVVSEHLVGT